MFIIALLTSSYENLNNELIIAELNHHHHHEQARTGALQLSPQIASILQGGPKIRTKHYNQFSKLFHRHNLEKICNNTVTKDPTAPQVCHYTNVVKCRVS